MNQNWNHPLLVTFGFVEALCKTRFIQGTDYYRYWITTCKIFEKYIHYTSLVSME